MKIYKIAQEAPEENPVPEETEVSLEDHYDFVGYHCRKAEWNSYGGYIRAEPHYIENWYREIVDSLPFDIRDLLLAKNMTEFEGSGYADIEEWGNDLEHFFDEQGIRWLFVKEQEPEYNYGAWCYYVLIPDAHRLAYLDDPHETNSSVILYRAKNPPKMIEVEDS